MAITAETRNDIIELVVTAYNAAPSTTLLTELVAIVDGGGTLADVANNLTTSATWKSLYPSFQTADEFATEWLGKLVPEASAEALAEGKTVVTGLINGGSSFGAIVLQAQTFLSATADTDAAFGTSVKVFDNKTAVATHYAVTKEQDGNIDAGTTALSGVTSDAATVTTAKASIDGDAASNTGATSTLTTGVDTVKGTAGDDTFKGVVSSTATSNTLGAGDNLDGLAGTDNLEIIFDGTGDLGPVTTIAGIENFFLKNFGTAANTANLANITGIAQVWNDGSTEGVNVTNLGSLATIGIRNTTVDTDVTFTNAAVTGTADSVTVLLDGVNNTATDVTIGATSGTEGVETVVINSSGSAANRLNSMNSDQTDFKTLTITGTQALTLDSVDSTLTTIDASGLSEKLTATISAATSAVDVKFTGTAKDDTITVGTTTEADVLDGGDGTDTIVSLGTFGATLTNFEAMAIAGTATPAANLEKAQSIAAVAVSHTAAITSLSVTNAAGGISASLSTDTASTLAIDGVTFSLKSATSSADSASLTLGGNGGYTLAALSTGGTAESNIDVTGIENFTLTANSDVAVGGAQANAGDAIFKGSTLEKVTIAGSGDVTLTTLGATGVGFSNNTGFKELDASGLTGKLVMDADTMDASATGALTIKGGSGNDTIFGRAGADTITDGAGNDAITGGAGNDVITLGSGNNTVNFSATTTNGKDTISSFSSTTDKLVTTAMTGGASAAVASLSTAAAADTTASRKDFNVLITTAGTAASITTGGTATLAEADMTATTLTKVAAFIAEKFTGNSTTVDADTGVYIINFESGADSSYIYQWDNDTVANVTQAAELTLVAVVSGSDITSASITV